MRVNEFISYSSFKHFVRIITSELNILASLLDLKRSAKEDLVSVICVMKNEFPTVVFLCIGILLFSLISFARKELNCL